LKKKMRRNEEEVFSNDGVVANDEAEEDQ